METTTTKTSNDLRAAIAAGDWVLAQSALLEFRNEVEMIWNAATIEDERIALQRKVEEMMEWARKTTLSTRSWDQQTLLRLVHGGAYTEARPVPGMFRLDV